MMDLLGNTKLNVSTGHPISHSKSISSEGETRSLAVRPKFWSRHNSKFYNKENCVVKNQQENFLNLPKRYPKFSPQTNISTIDEVRASEFLTFSTVKYSAFVHEVPDFPPEDTFHQQHIHNIDDASVFQENISPENPRFLLENVCQRNVFTELRNPHYKHDHSRGPLTTDNSEFVSTQENSKQFEGLSTSSLSYWNDSIWSSNNSFTWNHPDSMNLPSLKENKWDNPGFNAHNEPILKQDFVSDHRIEEEPTLGILHAKMEPFKKPECAFCKRNNAKNFNHLLKDSLGGVVCPVLSSFTCKMCAATGRNAHTHKYCPVNPITKGDPVAAGMPPGRPLSKSDKQWLKYFYGRYLLQQYLDKFRETKNLNDLKN